MMLDATAQHLRATPQTPDSQTGLASRLVTLDALRGFAVMGILLRNVFVFGIPSSAYALPELWSGPGQWDMFAWVFVDAGVDGTMRGLFSMLFGASALLLLEGSGQVGLTRVELYYRRALWLMLFGLVHAYLLLSPVDILFVYGLFGLMIYPLRNLQPRSLLAAAGVMIVASASIALALAVLAPTEEQAQSDQAFNMSGAVLQPVAAEQVAASSPESPGEDMVAEMIAKDWADEVNDRREGYLYNLFALAASSFENHTSDLFKTHLVDVGAFILIGMALFRMGVLSGARSTRFYIRTMVIGYLIGFGVNAAEIAWQLSPVEIEGMNADWTSATYDIGRGGVAIGHMCAVILLCRTRVLASLAHLLQAAGRMALSNYVLQTLICTTLFFGHGLGLYGDLTHSKLLGLGLSVTAMLVLLSWAYLRVFRQGPLEWLLRRLIRWKRPSSPDTDQAIAATPTI